MKKLLKGMLSITLAAVIGCTGCVNNGNGEDEIAPPTPRPDAQNCYPAVTSGTEFNGLDAMLVYYLAKNYKEQQLSAINNMPGMNDARSVWFDLETVKKFIYEIESQTCAKCDNGSATKLGIRIYYGAYPDSTKWNDEEWQASLEGVSVEYANKHTVMMVPTYHDEEHDIEVDFDPQFVTDGCNFSNIDVLYSKMEDSPPVNVTLSVLAAMSTTAQNHGQLIPPPYDRTEIHNNGAGIMYAVDTY